MVSPDPGPREAAIADAYRAIGRYFVEFSRLVEGLRGGINLVLQNGRSLDYGAYVLGQASAKHISDVFFNIVPMTYSFAQKLDSDEERVFKTVQKDVDAAITQRNDFAHGDWSVGAYVMDGDPLVPAPPMVMRYKPTRREGLAAPTRLTADELDAISDSIDELALNVRRLSTPIIDPTKRVRDSLRITNGRVHHPMEPEWATPAWVRSLRRRMEDDPAP